MNTLEELTEDRIDRLHVERRLEDWRCRLAALYADVASWVPKGWSTTEHGFMTMREELMTRFGVPDQQLPVLALVAPDNRRGRLEPRNLWMIGANGRVDLILPTRHFLIMDHSDSFEPADWQISDFFDRLRQEPFRQHSLHDALA